MTSRKITGENNKINNELWTSPVSVFVLWMWAHLYHCYGLFWDKRTKLSLMSLVKPEFFLWLHVKVLWKQKACSGGGMINSSYFIQIYVFRSHHSVISVQFIECKDLCRLLKLTFPETSIPYVGSYLYKMSNFKQKIKFLDNRNEWTWINCLVYFFHSTSVYWMIKPRRSTKCD